MEANIPLVPDDCVDFGGNRHPHHNKKMSSVAERLAAKKASRVPVAVAEELAPEEQEETREIIRGARKRAKKNLVLEAPENLGAVLAPRLVTSEGASDRADIAWNVAEVLRSGQFGEDERDMVQIYLDDYMRGGNAEIDEGSQAETVPNHDFSKQIDNPKGISTCVLFEPPLTGSDATADLEAPQSGLRLYQLSVWNVLRAMATAQRSDYAELFADWKTKHSLYKKKQEYEKSYDGFRLDRGVKHNGRLTPRGLLVNHSTGTGKTAVSVSALEAFWFQTDRPLLYVSTTKAVSFVIGTRAKADDSNDCGGVSGRSEYARLAQLFFPTTLGNDEAAYDPMTGGNGQSEMPFAKAKPNAKCTQSYLGNPQNLVSRLKALTFTQLEEFIEKTREGTVTDYICTTPTIIGKEKFLPRFGSNLQRGVHNAIIIVDEAHNLLQRTKEGFVEDLKELEQQLATNPANSDVLVSQIAALKETRACEKIHDYLLSEMSGGITLVFLTATPGTSPEEIDRLCRLLRKATEEQTLISYYNAENNKADFPTIKYKGDESVELTAEQVKEIARYDDEYNQLRESSIPISARDYLPSSFGIRRPTAIRRRGGGGGNERLRGGANEEALLKRAEKNSKEVTPEELMSAIKDLDPDTTLKSRTAKSTLIDTLRELVSKKAAEVATAAAEAEEEEEEEEVRPNVNENANDALEFDNYRAKWQREIETAIANLPPVDPSVKLPEIQIKEFVPRKRPEDFSVEVFTGTVFEQLAPKLALVANRLVENTPVKTFAYSAFSEATEGVEMLMEHKHGWRMISDDVIRDLKKFLSLDVKVSEDSEYLTNLDESITSGKDFASTIGNVRALVNDTKAMIGALISGTAEARQQDNGLPELEHMIHLNRDIPRSLRDINATTVKCEGRLQNLEGILDTAENREARFRELESIASDIIGARASADNMKSMISSVKNGDIAAVLNDILDTNNVSSAFRSPATASNPAGGKPRKRFVILNDTNAKSILAVFNHFLNRDGDIIMAILANGTAVEGLDLKTTRRLISIEPMITAVKLQQLIGRARRYCSHAELPADQQSVSFEVFFSRKNPEFSATANRAVEEWEALNEKYEDAIDEVYAEASEGVQEEKQKILLEVEKALEEYNNAVRKADQIRQQISNVRGRMKEAQSTGGVTHFKAIRLAGQLRGLQHVDYNAAIRDAEKSKNFVIETRTRYNEFQRTSGSALLREKIANLAPLSAKLEQLQNQYEEKYQISIFEKFAINSIDEKLMAKVKKQQLSLSARFEQLQKSAIDSDLLKPLMDFFARQ